MDWWIWLLSGLIGWAIVMFLLGTLVGHRLKKNRRRMFDE
jgi:hypothetical protein